MFPFLVMDTTILPYLYFLGAYCASMASQSDIDFTSYIHCLRRIETLFRVRVNLINDAVRQMESWLTEYEADPTRICYPYKLSEAIASSAELTGSLSWYAKGWYDEDGKFKDPTRTEDERNLIIRRRKEIAKSCKKCDERVSELEVVAMAYLEDVVTCRGFELICEFLRTHEIFIEAILEDWKLYDPELYEPLNNPASPSADELLEGNALFDNQ